MFKSVSYTLVSNIINFSISALVTFIVPKILGVESYGAFQLYVFYVSYVSMLHLGWADGIFLKYGGEHIENLRNKVFGSQLWIYLFYTGVVSVLFNILILIFVEDGQKQQVLFFTSIATTAILPSTLFNLILQSTNCIKKYAIMVSLDRIVYVSLVVFQILTGKCSYQMLMVADIIGRVVGAIYGLKSCSQLLQVWPIIEKSVFVEIVSNINIGMKLMFSNVCSSLIIGVIRFSIEREWDIATFGKVSLTLSVSNLLMVFIKAVSLTFFPMLRRTSAPKLNLIYVMMRSVLMTVLLGMLVGYYPIRLILGAWLPKYSESLKYMALLFPMCVFESKMSMLINTYLKTLRKEKWLLIVNVTTVTLSVVITLITTYWLHNLDLAVASIVFLLAFRCVFAELLLSTVLDVNVKTDIVLELALTIIFIGASWFVGGIAGLAIYAVAYLIYLFIKRNDVAFVLNTALRMVRRA